MSGIRLLSRADVERLLTIEDCIAAVESAFRLHAEGRSAGPASLSVHVDGGAFHVKAAALALSNKYFAAKTNGNFFGNPALGLPRIQGLIVLSDASNGRPLALLDSIAITILRTGAATAVAAKHLARSDARSLMVCGCGLQGRISIAAIRHIRAIETIYCYDTDRAKAEELAREAGGIAVETLVPADITVTCTPSKAPFITREMLHRGTFVAAVGADSNEKQEIDAEAMAAARVVVDDLDQCASFGDLRAAIEQRTMTCDDVAASLHDVIAGRKAGRISPEDAIIFDSTGTALQDVAAAAMVYERAIEKGAGSEWTP